MGPKRNKVKIQGHDKLGDKASRKPSHMDQRRIITSEPPGYVCTGNFATDFTYFCREMQLPYVPPVVARGAAAASDQELGLATGWDLACPPNTDHSPSRTPSDGFRGGHSALLGKKLRSVPSQDKARREIRLQKESSKGKLPPDLTRASRRRTSTTVRSREHSADLTTLQTADGDHEEAAGGYSTFSTKESHQCFIPVIQATFKGDMDQGSVTDLYIRDWKVDAAMMTALASAMAASEHLNSLQCWNTALDANTLSLLTESLQSCPSLTQLTLDNNPLGDLNVSALLGEDSRLEQLSLRFCQLTDLNAIGIGAALGTTFRANRTLRHLNLANNSVSDAGVQALARGLMTNRTLLTLNLAGNRIGDPGAVALAEALSDFPLDSEQMQERRRREFARLEKQLRRQSSVPPATSPSRGPLVADTDPKAKKSAARWTKMNRAGEREGRSATPGKDNNVIKSHSDRAQNAKEPRPSRKSSNPKQVGGGKRGKAVIQAGSPSPARSTSPAYGAQQQKENVKPEDQPLREAGLLIGGRLYVTGNRALLSLNLSRNSIGVTGLLSLWQMVQAQSRLDPAGPGLLRLELERNSFHRDHECLRLLKRHVSQRAEAHFQTQSPQTPDAVSIPADKQNPGDIISRSNATVA